MRKIQFCSGSLHLSGWENYDQDMDITKPLPVESGSVDYIFCEMGLEHVTPQQAWNFLEECYRILKPSGVARIVIPCLERMWNDMNEEYMRVNCGVTGCLPTPKDTIRSMIFCHGHQGAWTAGLLWQYMTAVGFKAKCPKWGESEHEPLRGSEQHGKSVGDTVARIESGIVEGTK